jgi:MFS-type transporter involved in bile tolerance (Atg22 family)
MHFRRTLGAGGACPTPIKESAAEFFGFYSVFSKAPGFWAVATVAVLIPWVGMRGAMSAVAVFFVVGIVLLGLVRESPSTTRLDS